MQYIHKAFVTFNPTLNGSLIHSNHHVWHMYICFDAQVV